MPVGKTFISYSRTDSIFALQLAKDISGWGAEVWVDQNDIKFGYWDSSVEKAIVSSECVIVVLSSTSAVSDNVKDEVSFALNHHKIVIPLLMNDCEIPIRLSRLQWVDFTGDYQLGLYKLLNALGLIAERKIISNDNLTVDKKKSGPESKSLTEFKKMAKDFLAKYGDKLNPE